MVSTCFHQDDWIEILTSNKSIADVLQLQKLNDVVDIGNLLLVGDLSRLSQNSRENKSFLDRCGSLVDIHLFAVSGHSLEGDSLRLSVDKNRATNFTSVLPLGKNIEKSTQSG